MDMSPQEYQAYVKGMQKKSPLLKDMALAFAIGGLILGLAGTILLFMRWPVRRRRSVR